MPRAVAVLTGLRHLELRSYVLPADSLLHLALLTGLTSLRVICYDIQKLEGDQAPEAGAPGMRTTVLAHLGALSGLTRLAQLSLRDWTPSYRLRGAQPATALLAALPSSPFLSEVCPGADGCRGLLAHLALGTLHTRGAHTTACQGSREPLQIAGAAAPMPVRTGIASAPGEETLGNDP
jgi:hypothetical protein